MRTSLKICLCVAGAAIPLGAYATTASDDSAAVQSTWKPQEIRYSYTGFTTAYGCEAYESKVKEILTTLGAHPQTKVRASGCRLDRPARHFFVTITTATPVATSDSASSTEVKSEEALLKRLGARTNLTEEQFTAAWKTVDLTRDRKLDLQPGDCELIEGLRDHVLQKLSIRIVADKVYCTPNQLSIQTPELQVSALVPVRSADGGQPVSQGSK
jgi:hypothetical protein